MKKMIQVNGEGRVVDITNVRDDANTENMVMVDMIPEFVPQEGYEGVLKYNEDGLYWEYKAVEPTERQLTSDEALNIILGGEE